MILDATAASGARGVVLLAVIGLCEATSSPR
jgi:hypothetical protein